MHRRAFLQTAMTSAVMAASQRTVASGLASGTLQHADGPTPTAYSIIPVLGDGKWIWTEPPDETGYLEPRPFDVSIGIQMEGTGPAQQVMSTTPVPIQLPEQEIKSAEIVTQGCRASLRNLASTAGQLMLVAPALSRGQVITAAVTMRLVLHKQHLGFAPAQFPVEQPPPNRLFRGQYLSDSPGIQTRDAKVRDLARRVRGNREHPWQVAVAFYEWVWENIQARPGTYTSVIRAVRDGVGDCEERAAVFVALCRASGIPARLVWVPNHNWAEIFLVDSAGHGHWIPVHTAAYSWFGWTGAHELVIQKGDNIRVPEKRQSQRLLVDWSQWQGARPRVQYLGALRPLATETDGDAGPGARRKDAQGRWQLLGAHDLDDQFRDGTRGGHYPP